MYSAAVRLNYTEDTPLQTWWRDRMTDVLIKKVNEDDGILLDLATTEFERMCDWRRVEKEQPQKHPPQGRPSWAPGRLAKANNFILLSVLLPDRAPTRGAPAVDVSCLRIRFYARKTRNKR